MRTTLDLPDQLMRRIKLRAVKENKKLKETIAELLQTGLQMGGETKLGRECPRALKLKGGHTMTIDEIDAAIGAGRE